MGQFQIRSHNRLVGILSGAISDVVFQAHGGVSVVLEAADEAFTTSTDAPSVPISARLHIANTQAPGEPVDLTVRVTADEIGNPPHMEGVCQDVRVTVRQAVRVHRAPVGGREA